LPRFPEQTKTSMAAADGAIVEKYNVLYIYLMKVVWGYWN